MDELESAAPHFSDHGPETGKVKKMTDITHTQYHNVHESKVPSDMKYEKGQGPPSRPMTMTAGRGCGRQNIMINKWGRGRDEFF